MGLLAFSCCFTQNYPTLFGADARIGLFSSKINHIETTTIRARGKLLLTAEYFVLDGALALALPTKAGQTFQFAPGEGSEGQIHWQSFDHLGQRWFEALFALNGECLQTSDTATAARLTQIFHAIHQLTDTWFPASTTIEARLDFPRHWGLGSSSTLIAALAQWAGVDAFHLLDLTFGGSGYDIACAFADEPVLYQRHGTQPNWLTFPFAPPFQEQLYFVGLGTKQDSREGIARYRARNPAADTGALHAISGLTADFVRATNLADFERCINEHEQLVSKTLELSRVAEVYFSDYWGAVKSLGAWGGDFVLATSQAGFDETVRYFAEKGYPEVFRYGDMGMGK